MMRMFLLDCGTMKFPYSVIIQDAHSQSDANTLVSAPIASFLIEHQDGYILFDTGCDPDGMHGNWPEAYRQTPFEESYLPERLAALGVTPDDIKYVVVSHLHFDHAGCLHLCKNARIFVNKTELDSTLYAYENGLDLNAHLESDIQNWMNADLTWEAIPPDVIAHPLADGVTILNFGPGHSWGMLGLMVALPAGDKYLLVSDTIYTKKNQGPPQRLPSILYDKEGYHKSIAFIESYASENNATIIYGHDMQQFQSLLEKRDGCIE